VIGEARLERCGLDGLQQAELLRAPQTPGIHGNQHIAGARGAFVLQSLDERVFAGLDAIHLDTGLLREVGIERVVGLIVARRVEIQHLLLRGSRQRRRSDRRNEGERQGASCK
jgi:hypothetical protein